MAHFRDIPKLLLFSGCWGMMLWAGIAVPAAGEKHSLAYFDAHYSGVLALCDQRLPEANQHFQQAAAMELGKDSFDLRKGQVDTLVRMALDGAPKPSDMANLAKEHQAIKLYFLAATLDSLKDLPAERRIGVLDSLIEQKLDETPWGMPPDCVLLVQFHRGKTYQSLGEKDQTCLVKALADFRGAASAAPRWPWGKEATEKAAQLLYGMKEYAQAASLYRAYLAEVPYAEDRALVLLNEGKCLLMLQDYATALQRFSQAVSEHPADAMADKAGKYRQYALKKLGAANAGSGPPDPPAAPAPAQP